MNQQFHLMNCGIHLVYLLDQYAKLRKKRDTLNNEA